LEADVFRKTAPDAARGNVEVILSSARLAVETRNGSRSAASERWRIREGFLVTTVTAKDVCMIVSLMVVPVTTISSSSDRAPISGRRRRRRLRQRVLSIQCA